MRREKFERPPTAQVAVLSELRRRIIAGELAPGQPIRQEALAAELGVSRLPVREALMVLQAEQLVSYTQHRGYVTTSLDAGDLVQTYRLRDLLETEAVEEALPRIGPFELEQMRQAGEAMESETDNLDLVNLNRQFHFALFSASQNERLISLLRQLWDACERYRALYFADQAARDRVYKEHRLILEACAKSDLARVQQLIAQHREGGLTEALRVFEAQQVSSGTTGH